jgi:hypothetical protein
MELLTVAIFAKKSACEIDLIMARPFVKRSRPRIIFLPTFAHDQKTYANRDDYQRYAPSSLAAWCKTR